MNCRNCQRGIKIYCEYQDVWELNGIQYKGCPFKITTTYSFNMLRAYMFYKNGYLPNQGGWLDQPAKFIDAVIVLDNEFNKSQENAD